MRWRVRVEAQAILRHTVTVEADDEAAASRAAIDVAGFDWPERHEADCEDDPRVLSITEEA